MSRWCSGTSMKKFMWSLRKTSYLLCGAWLQSSSFQVKWESVRSYLSTSSALVELFPANQHCIITSACCRWASHLWNPLIWYTKERVVISAETGGCDKVEGVSNEISPCKSVWYKLIFFGGWEAVCMPDAKMIHASFCISFSLYRSEQNEYSVDKAAVKRIGDILCKSVYLRCELFFDEDVVDADENFLPFKTCSLT